IVVVFANEMFQRSRVNLIPSPLLAEQRFIIIAWMKLKRVDQIAVNARIGESDDQGTSIAGNGIPDISAVFISVAKIVRRIAHAGAQRKTLLVYVHGFVELAVFLEGDAEVVERLGQIGSEFDRSP